MEPDATKTCPVCGSFLVAEVDCNEEGIRYFECDYCESEWEVLDDGNYIIQFEGDI